jgi:hypothetical protein
LQRQRKHWSPPWPFRHPDSNCESPRIRGRISAMASWTPRVRHSFFVWLLPP